jgi:hypothetical protein
MVFANICQPHETVDPEDYSPWHKLRVSTPRVSSPANTGQDHNTNRNHVKQSSGIEAQVQKFFDEDETMGVVLTEPPLEAMAVGNFEQNFDSEVSVMLSEGVEKYREVNDYDRFIAQRKLGQEFPRLPHRQLLLCILQLIPRVFPSDPLDSQQLQWHFLGRTYTYKIRNSQSRAGALYLDQIPYPLLGFSEDKFTIFLVMGLPRLGTEFIASVLIQFAMSAFKPLQELGLVEALRVNELFSEDEYKFEFKHQGLIFYWQPGRHRIAVKLPGYLASCEYSSTRFGVVVDWCEEKLHLDESLAYLTEEGLKILEAALKSLADDLGWGVNEIPIPELAPSQEENQDNLS